MAQVTQSPFWEYISLRVEQAENGQSSVRIDIFEQLMNRAQTVQGGVLATLIDIATGSAVTSTLQENEQIVTTELKINYLLPATGVFIVGKGTVKHKGNTLAIANAEIFNEEGKLVALGSASFMILREV